MNNPYQQAIYEVKEYTEKNQCTRADRFSILESLTGIDEGTARIVDRYLRAIREVIEPDEVCKSKEKEWHKPKYLHDWEYQNAKRFSQQILM